MGLVQVVFFVLLTVKRIKVLKNNNQSEQTDKIKAKAFRLANALHRYPPQYHPGVFHELLNDFNEKEVWDYPFCGIGNNRGSILECLSGLYSFNFDIQDSLEIRIISSVKNDFLHIPITYLGCLAERFPFEDRHACLLSSAIMRRLPCIFETSASGESFMSRRKFLENVFLCSLENREAFIKLVIKVNFRRLNLVQRKSSAFADFVSCVNKAAESKGIISGMVKELYSKGLYIDPAANGLSFLPPKNLDEFFLPITHSPDYDASDLLPYTVYGLYAKGEIEAAEVDWFFGQALGLTSWRKNGASLFYSQEFRKFCLDLGMGIRKESAEMLTSSLMEKVHVLSLIQPSMDKHVDKTIPENKKHLLI